MSERLQRNLFASCKRTSNFTSISLRKVSCFGLKGDSGFGTLPLSSDRGILMGQNTSIGGQDHSSAYTVLRADAVKHGTISADMYPTMDDFSVDDNELDLDCPTEGFSSIPEAIEDIRQGKVCHFYHINFALDTTIFLFSFGSMLMWLILQFVIVVDDEDRENEGDLIMAASLATPEAMAFIVRHGTGIVCVSMKGEDLERLQLPLMVTNKENEEKLCTAFTVSVVRSLFSLMR